MKDIFSLQKSPICFITFHTLRSVILWPMIGVHQSCLFRVQVLKTEHTFGQNKNRTPFKKLKKTIHRLTKKLNTDADCQQTKTKTRSFKSLDIGSDSQLWRPVFNFYAPAWHRNSCRTSCQ